MVASGIQPRAELGLNCVSETYELTAALVLDDVIQMVKIPVGAIIQEVILSVDDLDGATSLTLSVGDGDDPNRYIQASTIGQAGGTARMAMVTTIDCHNYTYTADDTIDVHAEAVSGSETATGTIVLTVFYTFQE
jgi:hypothetical protein